MLATVDIAARVERGFNKLTPEQRARIDLHALHMDSDWDCVLGQIYGRYAFGIEALFPECMYDHEMREKLGMEYGFFQTYRDPDAFAIYAELQTEWLRLLENERNIR